MGVVVFTGHRSLAPYLGEDSILDSWLWSALTLEVRTEGNGKGNRSFRSGMELGFDLLAAIAVIRAGREGRGAYDLVGYMPFLNYSDTWSQENKTRLDVISRGCLDIIFTTHCELSDHNEIRAACLNRNERMLRDSPKPVRVIAAWDGRESGGTYYTMNLAYELEIPVTILRLDSQQIIRTNLHCKQENQNGPFSYRPN